MGSLFSKKKVSKTVPKKVSKITFKNETDFDLWAFKFKSSWFGKSGNIDENIQICQRIVPKEETTFESPVALVYRHDSALIIF